MPRWADYTGTLGGGDVLAQLVSDDVGVRLESVPSEHISFSKETPWNFLVLSSRAAAEKSLSSYSRDLRGLCRALWNGSATKFEFVDALFTAMRRGFSQAWQEGRDRVGAGKMTDEDMLRVQDIVMEQATYAPGFADFIEANDQAAGGKFSSILPRATQWMAKYEEVAAEATAAAQGEQRLRWVYDPEKEHCSDCAKLNGRVYTARTWTKYNLHPMAYGLECGPGRRCGCRFEPTGDPVTPGRPPVDLRKDLLMEIFRKSFEGHRGRPGKRGGSLPRKSGMIIPGLTLVEHPDISDEDRLRLLGETSSWEGLRSGVAERAITAEFGRIIEFSDKNELIGVANLSFESEGDKLFLKVNWFSTKRPGYGKRIFESFFARAKSRGAGISLESLREAEEFYEKIGMRLTGTAGEYNIYQFSPDDVMSHKELVKEPASGIFAIILEIWKSFQEGSSVRSREVSR